MLQQFNDTAQMREIPSGLTLPRPVPEVASSRPSSKAGFEKLIYADVFILIDFTRKPPIGKTAPARPPALLTLTAFFGKEAPNVDLILALRSKLYDFGDLDFTLEAPAKKPA
jgi:hypothetical protein